jgi:hypothetical protein
MIGDGEQVAIAPVREHRTRPSARLVSDLCANDPARCLDLETTLYGSSLNTIF